MRKAGMSLRAIVTNNWQIRIAKLKIESIECAPSLPLNNEAAPRRFKYLNEAD